MNRLPKTRHSLLMRLANASDGTAWSEFLDVYELTIYRFACSRGLQPADAEDVTQRVLAAVLEKSRDWRPDATQGSFGAWLFRVTRNQAAKTWKERINNPLGAGGSDHGAILAEVPELSDEEKTIFHTEYRRALFRWAADRVRDRVEKTTWTVFWMTAIDGLNADEVSRSLGISLSSVYTAKCRMLARIRNEIDGFENDLSICRDRSFP